MADDHVRGGTPQVNPNEPIFTEQEDKKPVRKRKRPPRRVLPRATRATVNTLAADIHMDTETLRRWVMQNNCPFKSPGGGEMWIDTEELWNSWPNRSAKDFEAEVELGRAAEERTADGPANPRPSGRRKKPAP